MKKMISVLSLVALVPGSAGAASAAPAHGGHGGSGRQGRSAFHGGAREFHGDRGFHRGGHSRAFIGVAPFVVDPFPIYAAPSVYSDPAPYGYWYYCPSAGAYYPTVGACPVPWVPVPVGG